MHILILGGSGFIGGNLTNKLLEQDHQVTILTRSIIKAKPRVHPKAHLVEDINSIALVDIIINLSGEPLDKKRWSTKQKQILIDSRVKTTTAMINWINKSGKKPSLLINGSAIGFYGDQSDKSLDELASPNEEFTHFLCKSWEQEALKAEQYGVRVCLLRTGIVLGKNGGMLSKVLLPFKLGLGSTFNDGNQWMSWIHIQDLIGIILHIIKTPEVSGPINGTSPNPVTNATFTKTLGQQLNRPTFLKIPALVLKIILGEMSNLVVSGQKVVPKKILSHGYAFLYPSLALALKDLL